IEVIDKPTPGLLRIRDQVQQLEARRSELDHLAATPPDKANSWADARNRLVCAEWERTQDRPRKEVQGLLDQALKNEPELGPALALRGRLALESGKLAKAVIDAEKAIRYSPRDPGGWYVRGRVRLERGDRDALLDLTKAAELSERRDADVLHALACALF